LSGAGRSHPAKTGDVGSDAGCGISWNTHDWGAVRIRLAVSIADGAKCLTDIEALSEQPELFGDVASSPARPEEDAMQDPRRCDVGLFCYSLAREPAQPRLSKVERAAIVRALTEASTCPDGRRIRVAQSTIDRSVRELRGGGLPGPRPCPPTRSRACGACRMTAWMPRAASRCCSGVQPSLRRRPRLGGLRRS
jgi:hypothetical protein